MNSYNLMTGDQGSHQKHHQMIKEAKQQAMASKLRQTDSNHHLHQVLLAMITLLKLRL